MFIRSEVCMFMILCSCDFEAYPSEFQEKDLLDIYTKNICIWVIVLKTSIQLFFPDPLLPAIMEHFFNI